MTFPLAHTFLASGNAGAYARLVSSEIRAASPARAAQLRAMVYEDGAAHLFRGLDTDCPVAAPHGDYATTDLED